MKTEQRKKNLRVKQGNREVFQMKSLEGSMFNCGTTPKGEGKTITISQKLLCEACIIQPRELIYQDHSKVKL